MDKKILIVDDDIDTLQLVGTMLERQGFKILAANNGEKAINLAQAETPDLIILDVMMPGMDGYEVTRRLRAAENTAFIPIILFTAKAQVDDKVEGFESGADDYLTKPTHPAELIARVKTILTRPKTGALTMPEEAAEEVTNNEIFSLISAKGGLGVSTLALNLAVSIHQQTDQYVTLAEFRPGVGTIGLNLGYRNSDALNILLKKSAAEIRANEVEDQLITHGSGIQLLLASFNPADAALISQIANFEAIAKHLTKISPYTIFDLGPGLHDANRILVKMSSQILVLVEPYPTTILQTKQLINDITAIGISHEQIKIILVNRVRLEITVPANKVQQGLDMPVAGVITPAPELAYQSVLRHEPMILHQPGSIVASQINKLANSLVDPELF